MSAPQESNQAENLQHSQSYQQQQQAVAAAAAAVAAATAPGAAIPAVAGIPTGGTAPGGHPPQFDINDFWIKQMALAKSFDSDFKNHPLPLARIKKVMKTDQDVKMISAEAPILFAKGCEIFITELTRRAWVHAEENKRRTLQRSDIATAITKTDMCDFLIDIVPREEASKSANPDNYASYYQSQPPYGAHQPFDPAAYYPQLSQLTPEQMQQYQLQLQHMAFSGQPAAGQSQPAQASNSQPPTSSSSSGGVKHE